MNIAYLLAGLAAAIVMLFVVLGVMSQSGGASGVVEGKLARCPLSPNCACSEFKDDATHYVEPIAFATSPQGDVLALLTAAVIDLGGIVRETREDYLAATFTSAVFRFVDDVEMRIDREHGLIHLRSASRVGYGDGGVNRKRGERLKRAVMDKLR